MLKVSKRFIDHVVNASLRTSRAHTLSRLILKGRIPFYDQYGVIRDVLQNHLTEVMTLLTMKLPANVSNSEEVLQNKLQIFSSLLPLGKNQAVIGQYQTYKSEVQQELNKTKDHITLTPTFAGECTTFTSCMFCTDQLFKKKL